MNTTKLSSQRIKNIREQGYINYSDQEIINLSIGNGFAYKLCAVILSFGVITAHIPVLTFILVVAFLGVILPNHPFDYIYNRLIANRIGRPKLPVRSKQLKFACTMATLVIASTIYFFLNGQMLAGYIMGGQIVLAASIVAITDFCIPSKIYNWLFKVPIPTSV